MREGVDRSMSARDANMEAIRTASVFLIAFAFAYTLTWGTAQRRPNLPYFRALDLEACNGINDGQIQTTQRSAPL
jgi:hypothetical protein